jgi:aspartate/methionine/tyrosine aminotransferase
VTSSFTKAFGLGTVRFGWVLAEPATIERILRFNDLVSVLYPAPSAWVGDVALRCLPSLQRRATEFRDANLPVVTDWARSRPDVEWVPPGAGVIAFPRLKTVADTLSFSERLREEHDVQVVPGEFFESAGSVRIGFGVGTDVLREGLRRFAKALDGLRGQ